MVAVAFAIALLYFGLYLGLQACALCIVDRIILSVIALFFIIAIIWPKKYFLCHVVNICLSIFGIVVASRHIWLQSSLEETASCVAGIDYLFEILPVYDFIAFLFNTGISCTQIMWSILGFSIPDLTLLLFIVLYFISGSVLYVHVKEKLAVGMHKQSYNK